MRLELSDYQLKAINDLRSGSILVGGVGSGKSRTALGYFYKQVCGGDIHLNQRKQLGKMKTPTDLVIITTAKKRDSLEWEKECSLFYLSKDKTASMSSVQVSIDSWNNIKKYENIESSFFIFDEQRVVGSGAWVKSFIKITKKNKWILLSATPGDTWMDYIPVFIANGFYRNRTEFLREHVVYNRFLKYPKVEKIINTGKLIRLRNSITVKMKTQSQNNLHHIYKNAEYNTNIYNMVFKNRWNPFKELPIRDGSELCYTLRRVVNSDTSRIEIIKEILKKNKKIIIFYNFDYELEILRSLKEITNIAELNGHKHETIPKEKDWVYLVQYSAGAEAWNCIETNVIVFYSQNYSYKIMTQSAGRIDRVNTPFVDLYYYHLISNSSIDSAIAKALREKKNFNEKDFIS